MQRPKSATVFGILNIAFATMSFFGLIFSIIVLRIAASSHSTQLIKQSPVLSAWTKFTMPLGFVSAIVLLIAGIGLLMMKNWARIVSIIYAIYSLVFGVVGLALMFLFMVMPMIEQSQQQSGPESIGMIAGAIGGMIGGVVGLAYPVLLLIFMTRPKLVEAFRVAELLSAPGQSHPPAA
ncbi:MAG: hypothetical protein JWO95_648 [Verrucomicrobiales bacterium]|nr:hypothetical protein [Verrucomicrobiales bacterium]